MKRKSYVLLLISALCFISCKDTQTAELNPQWNYDSIKGFGTSKKHEFTFCGIVPKVIEYEYKVGLWAFYTPQKVKIAEGIFDKELVEVSDRGGCSYSYYENTMNPEKWKFWDHNGKSIPLNKRDLDFILYFEEYKDTSKLLHH
ncbi:hypothetical protein [Kordia jejudonensis]|uniref:hypothetical protein n=1 Tax=Kordia jejudonensis TaxID=1348245 RepID=UPI0012E058A0|nr:hypothetical protein [Kordia jejudonensis]